MKKPAEKISVSRRSVLALGAASLLGAGCAAQRGVAATRPPDRRREQLDELARRYEALMAEHGLFEWSRYAGKLTEGPQSQATIKRLRQAERDVFRRASVMLQDGMPQAVSPRQRSLWLAGHRGLELLGDPEAAALADELEAVVSVGEIPWQGQRVSRKQLTAWRRSQRAEERRNVRRVEHQLHLRAAPIAKKLLLRRKKVAALIGEESFYAALRRLRGVDQTAEVALRELDLGTRVPFDALRKRARRELQSPLRPWDLNFVQQTLFELPPHERLPEARNHIIARQILERLGVHFEQGMNVTERDFGFGGQTIAVSVPDDVRLVVRAAPGLRALGTNLHELGHVFHVSDSRPLHPLYAGYEWVPGLLEPAYAEGVGETLGRLLDLPFVLMEFAGYSESEAARTVEARRARLALGIRRGLAWMEIERSLHEHPEGDLDVMSLAVERRLWGGLPSDAEPTWATSPFLANYPAYSQSYILASVVALQVRAALRRNLGNVLSVKAGDHLRSKFVRDGMRWTLREKLIATTGSPLSVSSLIQFMQGADV